MRRLLSLLVFSSIVCGHLQALAATPTQTAVRYHLGDDADGKLGWADPGLDDSAWPAATASGSPRPAFYSDGHLWVRTRVEVPTGVQGPLAIEVFNPDSAADVEEVFVNGVAVGSLGRFPPHSSPVLLPRSAVFTLPSDTAMPGSTAVVVLREWFMPASRGESPHAEHFVIDRAAVVQTAQYAERAKRLIREAPYFGVAALLELLGVVVLWLARKTRQRDLLISGAWLIALPAYLVMQTFLFELRQETLSEVPWNLSFSIVNAVGMGINVEFLYFVLGVRNHTYRLLAHSMWIVLTLTDVLSATAFAPRPYVLPLPQIGHWALVAFNIIGIVALFWVLFVKRQNQFIAGAMCLIAAAAFLNGAAIFPVSMGDFPRKFFDAAFFLAGLAIAASLLQKALAAWRISNDLRVEFQSAREVQQRLVPHTLPPTPGYRIESAYLPAAEVGGDFFQVIPQAHQATLVVLGDVSGKGLKAAMTGTLAIGALRALAAEDLTPGQVLTRLNRQMVAASNGGFITCLCALLHPDGTLVMANAGHLGPYLNGSEIALENGLPLGLTLDAEYVESRIHAAPNDSLTLLTDGVLEATSPSGELFGFDRTEDISRRSADEIARTAQIFGQEDDITVLTLTLTAAEGANA